MDELALKEAAREVRAYEDWKDSDERYEWSADRNKGRCCQWLHRTGTPCPVDETAAA